MQSLNYIRRLVEEKLNNIINLISLVMQRGGGRATTLTKTFPSWLSVSHFNIYMYIFHSWKKVGILATGCRRY